MFKLPVYFISDNHFKLDITFSEKKRRKYLFNIFKKIKETGGSLVIGGDFFDFWFYYPKMIPAGYTDILLIDISGRELYGRESNIEFLHVSTLDIYNKLLKKF